MADVDKPISLIDLAVDNTDASAPIYDRYSNTTQLQRFLFEEDPYNSLDLWLKHFSKTSKPTQVKQLRSAILRDIATLDHLITQQLNLILHHRRFQQLEASWRGLWQLASEHTDTKTIKIKVLSISWREVTRDINKALEFDQSQLFKKIYTEEFGTPGGEPYGTIIGDYYLAHRPTQQHPDDDLATLEGLSQIAAAAFAPFITAVSYEFFGIDDFDSLAMPQDYNRIFSQDEYIKWRSFRSKPDSRFVGLTLPRILMREPYNTELSPMGGILYKEDVSSRDKEKYLWGNSCYAFAHILLREFSSVGWFGHIRGVPRGILGGGLIDNLTVDYFRTDPIGIAHKMVTDVLITDRVERRLSNQGFIPLCQCYNTEYAAFYSNQSVQKPKIAQTKLETTNAQLSTMLQHILCSSRIAHYLKVITREKIGSFNSAKDCQNYLQKWINRYVTGRDDLEWSKQSRYPLREARIEVMTDASNPGIFMCIMRLKPHYQLDHMVSELELVTELSRT